MAESLPYGPGRCPATPRSPSSGTPGAAECTGFVRVCVLVCVCALVGSDRVRMKGWKWHGQEMSTVCVDILHQLVTDASALINEQFGIFLNCQMYS